MIRADERSSGMGHGLQPFHVQVLRYLSICNRYSNTPVGVTDFMGVTKGTVSQSVNVLERKGLITKSPDARDGRVVHLNVTEAGRRLIESEFPRQDILATLDEMHFGERQNLAGLLTDLLIGIQHRNDGRLFGECRTCIHFRKDAFGDSHQCALTLEPLSDDDSTKICREHELSVDDARHI